ncbi:MAG: hypothetical protein COC10_12785 [Sphingobium sp.]|nr:MAG: hypothetical protein COC10_12785 [Sphingobium sp.]
MSQQILKLSEVKKITGLSGSSIYRKAADPEDSFPRPIKLSIRSSGFLQSEISQWLQERIEASRNDSEVA